MIQSLLSGLVHWQGDPSQSYTELSHGREKPYIRCVFIGSLEIDGRMMQLMIHSIFLSIPSSVSIFFININQRGLLPNKSCSKNYFVTLYRHECSHPLEAPFSPQYFYSFYYKAKTK